MKATHITGSAPIIRRLTIERFRGLKTFDWRPAPGLNLILGGGDAGKSTILDAISLLLGHSILTLSDTDYFNRDTGSGFVVEAVLDLPTAQVGTQKHALFPWHWDGGETVQPPNDGTEMSPVYRLRVSGTPDLDLAYECVLPNDEAETFSVSFRRSIGLVRLGGDDRNDRDLRLVQGSALDRLLGDRNLRARLGVEFANAKLENQLKENAAESLRALDSVFETQALPHNLGLGINVGQGQSLSSLVALTAKEGDVALPLMNWGAGTRRLAALAIAGAWRDDTPITVVDEVERGLEPYRQRQIVKQLIETGNQVFLTTHSATAIKAAMGGSLWHLAPGGVIGCLDAQKTRAHQQRDPEAFLARLSIIAEGQTEVGFAHALLSQALSIDLDDYGVRLTDAVGHDEALDLLTALAEAGLSFGGFVDNEGRSPQRWKAVQDRVGGLLMQWPSGCVEENVLKCVSDDDLIAFASDPASTRDGNRRGSIMQRLWLLRDDKSLRTTGWDQLRQACGADFRELIRLSALGHIDDAWPLSDAQKRELKGSAKTWFKNAPGGTELFAKAVKLGCLPKLAPQLLPFVNAVAVGIGRPTLQALA